MLTENLLLPFLQMALNFRRAKFSSLRADFFMADKVDEYKGHGR